MSAPVSIVVRVQIKPEYIDEFKKEVIAMAPVIAAEPECLFFNATQSLDDPSMFLVYETWISKEHFMDIQLKKPYYVPYLERTKKMWASEDAREFEFVQVLYSSKGQK